MCQKIDAKPLFPVSQKPFDPNLTPLLTLFNSLILKYLYTFLSLRRQKVKEKRKIIYHTFFFFKAKKIKLAKKTSSILFGYAGNGGFSSSSAISSSIIFSVDI